MNLGAYVQIEDLMYILQEQAIEIPRLRGLMLMKDVKPLDTTKIKDDLHSAWCSICEDIVEQGCRDYWSSDKHDTRNDILIRKTNENGYRKVIGVRWGKVHGKKRKRIKYEFKKQKKAILRYYEIFNKYAGQNVLYVHARIGGFNWIDYGGDKITKHPDYLDRYDNAWDETYCTMFFKLHKNYELIEKGEDNE